MSGSASSEWMAAVAATLTAQTPPTPDTAVVNAASHPTADPAVSQAPRTVEGSASETPLQPVEGLAMDSAERPAPDSDMADIFGADTPALVTADASVAVATSTPAAESGVGSAEAANLAAASAPSLLDVFGDETPPRSDSGTAPGHPPVAEPIFDPFAEVPPADSDETSRVPHEEGADEIALSAAVATAHDSPLPSGVDDFDPFAEPEPQAPADRVAPDVVDADPRPQVAVAAVAASSASDDTGSALVELLDDVSTSTPGSTPDTETPVEPLGTSSSEVHVDPETEALAAAPTATESEEQNTPSGTDEPTGPAYTPRRARPVGGDVPAGQREDPASAVSVSTPEAALLAQLAARLGLTDAETVALAIRILATAHRLPH